MYFYKANIFFSVIYEINEVNNNWVPIPIKTHSKDESTENIFKSVHTHLENKYSVILLSIDYYYSSYYC